MKKQYSEINLEFLDKALLISLFKKSKFERILVLADLHVGWEESLNKSGVFVPRMQFKETLKEIKDIFSYILRKYAKIDEIIVLGDLKHEFGIISRQEWRETEKILDFFKKHSKKIILVRGNHDTILEPIAKRKELKIRDYYKKDGICFLHGHKVFSECLDKNSKMLILGHRHPAVTLHDEYKKEKYKCFLVGKWKKKKIIILPSFFPFIEGSDVVNIEDNRMFIPEKNLKGFETYVIGNDKKIYRFGKLKNLI
jgi:hypothetical protein